MERGTEWGMQTPVIPFSSPPISVLCSEPRLSGTGGAESDGRTKEKSCLSVWNCIIFNYLDHDGSHSPSLPLPFHLVTQTQAFLIQPCLSAAAALFPSLPRAASPLLITPINIFDFCHFSVSVLCPCVCLSFFFVTYSCMICHMKISISGHTSSNSSVTMFLLYARLLFSNGQLAKLLEL